MKPGYRSIVFWVAFGLVSPLAFGQAPDSQNTRQDIANSLAPAPPRRGPEKMEQADPQKLPSSRVKDPAFAGSLLNMGLGSTGDVKPHEEKAGSTTDKDSKAKKEADTGSEKGSKAQNSKGAGDDAQNKGQRSALAGSNDKPSDKEKASASKTDGNH
jgi:hypothetical protein